MSKPMGSSTIFILSIFLKKLNRVFPFNFTSWIKTFKFCANIIGISNIHHLLASYISNFILLNLCFLPNFSLLSGGSPLEIFHIPSTTNLCHKFMEFLFLTKYFNHCCRYLFEHIFNKCVIHSTSYFIIIF